MPCSKPGVVVLPQNNKVRKESRLIVTEEQHVARIACFVSNQAVALFEGYIRCVLFKMTAAEARVA